MDPVGIQPLNRASLSRSSSEQQIPAVQIPGFSWSNVLRRQLSGRRLSRRNSGSSDIESSGVGSRTPRTPRGDVVGGVGIGIITNGNEIQRLGSMPVNAGTGTEASDQNGAGGAEQPPAAAAAAAAGGGGDGADDDADNLPREVVILLDKLQGVLPFVLLLMLRFLYRHAMGLIYFFSGTLILMQYDKKLKAQMALRNVMSTPKCLLVAFTMLLFLWASNELFYAAGDAEIFQRLFLVPIIEDPEALENGDSPYSSIVTVIWTVAVADLWVRFLVVALKACVLAVPERCICCAARGAGGYVEIATAAAGNDSRRGVVNNSDSTGAAANGAGAVGGGGGADVPPDTNVISKKKKIYAVIEISSLLYRTLIPVPVWYAYYVSDPTTGEYFAAIYLLFKCMVLGFRSKLFAHGLKSLFRGQDLEVGRLCTAQEIEEAGSPDCSICYDNPMLRPVELPCKHMFCSACVAEWLERERTCPLCRASAGATNPIPLHLRDGSTSLVPLIL